MVQASQPDTDSSTGPRTPLPWTPATIIHLAFAGDVDFAVRAVNNHDKLLEALKEVEKGEGDFSRDQLTHAMNTVDNMKRIAHDAIEEAQP